MSQTQKTSMHACEHCGDYHGGVCPLVASVEYYENGAVKKVSYKDGFQVAFNGEAPNWKTLEADLSTGRYRDHTLKHG
jgi:hypothetical protein